MERYLEREREMAEKREKELLRLIEQQQKIKMNTLRYVERKSGNERPCNQKVQKEVEQGEEECCGIKSEAQRETDRDGDMRDGSENTVQRAENEKQMENKRKQERWQEMEKQLKTMEQRFEMEREMEAKRYEERWRNMEERRQKEWEERRSELERTWEKKKQGQVLLKVEDEENIAKQAYTRTEIQAKVEKKETKIMEETRELQKVMDKSNQCVRENEKEVQNRKDTEVGLREQAVSQKTEEMDWLKELRNTREGEREKEIERQQEKRCAPLDCWFEDFDCKNKSEMQQTKSEDWWSDLKKQVDQAQKTEKDKEMVVRPRARNVAKKTDGDKESLLEINEQKTNETISQKNEGMDWLNELKAKQEKKVDSEIHVATVVGRRQRSSEVVRGKTEPESTHKQLEDDWLGDMAEEKKWAEIRRKNQQRREESRQELQKVMVKGNEGICEIEQKVDKRKDAEVGLQEQAVNQKTEGRDWLKELTREGGREREIERKQVKRCGPLGCWLEDTDCKNESQTQQKKSKDWWSDLQTEKNKGMVVRPKTRNVARKTDGEEESLREVNKLKTKEGIHQRNEGMDWLGEFNVKEGKEVDSGSHAATVVGRRQRSGEVVTGKTEPESKHNELEDDWLGDIAKEDKWAQIRRTNQQSREESRQALQKKFNREHTEKEIRDITWLENKQNKTSQNSQKKESWIGQWMLKQKCDSQKEIDFNGKKSGDFWGEQDCRRDNDKTAKKEAVGVKGLGRELLDTQVTEEPIANSGRSSLWEILRNELDIQPCGSWKETSQTYLEDTPLGFKRHAVLPMQQTVMGHQRAATDEAAKHRSIRHAETLEVIRLDEPESDKNPLHMTDVSKTLISTAGNGWLGPIEEQKVSESDDLNVWRKDQDRTAILQRKTDARENTTQERQRQKGRESILEGVNEMRAQKEMKEENNVIKAEESLKRPSVVPLLCPSSDASNGEKRDEEQCRNASAVSAEERAQPVQDKLLGNTENQVSLGRSPSLINLFSGESDDEGAENACLSSAEMGEQEVVASSERTEGEAVNDKSVRRRLIGWVNKKAKDYYNKKIEKTFVREEEEGDRMYFPCKMFKIISVTCMMN